MIYLFHARFYPSEKYYIIFLENSIRFIIYTNQPLFLTLLSGMQTGHLPSRRKTEKSRSYFMIRKIISGGQAGVERAALDVARNLYIAFEGWITPLQAREKNELVTLYRLRIVSSDDLQQSMEQNILDSDGVLIIIMGELTGNAAVSQRIALRHDLPFLIIQMDEISAFEAAKRIEAWMTEYGIEILCITGSGAEFHADIYRMTKSILEVVFQLNFIDPRRYENIHAYPSGESQRRVEEFIRIPRSVREAVEYLMKKLSFQERSKIANMNEKRLGDLSDNLGIIIRDEFRLWGANDALLKDCRKLEEEKGEEAEDVIIRALWYRLQKSDNVLRVVK